MPGRNYVIDRHPQKKEIVEAILSGESFRSISKQFGITDTCVLRYSEGALKKDLAIYIARQKESDLNTIDGLVKRLNKMAEVCQKLIDRCMEYLGEDGAIDVSSMKESTHKILKDNIANLRAILETIGKFLGMVSDVNVVTNINLDTSKFVSRIADIIEDVISDPNEKAELVRRIHDGL